MSTADDAWQEWVNSLSHSVASPGLIDCTHKAFLAGYRRALEDAAKEIAELVPYGYGMNPDGTEDRTAMAYVEGNREAWQVLTNRLAGVGTKDGDDDE